MIDVLSSAFYFVVALGILVTIHEFGHYWTARRMGVKVLRFSIGFGKAIWTTRRGPDHTEYVLSAIPLGGYVRMLDEREGQVVDQERHRAFNRQSLRIRFAIVVAGPLCNFLLAIIAYWLVFVIGVAGVKPIVGTIAPDSLAAQGGFKTGDVILAVETKPTPTWQGVILTLLNKTLDEGSVVLEVRDQQGQLRIRTLELKTVQKSLERGNLLDALGIQPYRPRVPAVIGSLEPAGPAERAGVEVGDRIAAIDGKTIDDWEQFVEYVRAHPEQLMRLDIQRAGVPVTAELRPERQQSKDGDYGHVGAGVRLTQEVDKDLVTVQRYAPPAALWEALTKTWDMSALTLRMLWGMVSGHVSLSNISGPISIAKYAGYSAQAGIVPFLVFLAIVSISLGVLNLLPVPLLDGGHLLYYVIEMIKGSPLSDTAQLAGQRVGMVLLLSLMAVAFYNDISHFFR